MSQPTSDFGSPYHESDREDPSKKPITAEEHQSENFHRMGTTLPYGDYAARCVSSEAGQVGQSGFAAASDHSHNFVVPAVLGTPTDEMFTEPIDGCMCIDAVARRLYIRISGVWRYATLI